jgi:dextranase
MLTITDVAPDRATYRPGQTAHITVTLANSGADLVAGQLIVELVHLDTPIDRQARAVDLPPGASAQVVLPLMPPPAPLRGYGLDASFVADNGTVVARASGALDVLERWSQAPRYGFLSDFAPGQPDVAERCASLCRYHLNVVQFYDWMWRHYVLLPPPEQLDGSADESFTDALGRRLALGTVRAAIAGVQARGAAALAYGTVYGAEPEYADAHPELALFDEQGQRISLAELFYIMNIAPESPWVPLIVAEFARAVRALDFDGIHLDQYGFPKTARSAAGELVDLADHFPPLIDAARAAVVEARPDAGVIFNAVGNWPIETVGPTTQDVVYIEVWPPDEHYDDLRRLIADARRLGGGKPVILAAYLSAFLDCPAAELPRAEAAALLATAAIASCGGSHLLLGERDGILCDPYYPKYATLRPEFVPRLRAYYDVLVRYQEWLVAPDIADWDDAQIELGGAPFSRSAAAGHVWVIARQRPGYRIISLINLADQPTAEWNALRTPPQQLRELRLGVAGAPAQRALAITPDARGGQATALEWSQADGHMQIKLPTLDKWTIVLLEFLE